MHNKPILDLTHPNILTDLQKIAPYSREVNQLLKGYLKAKKAGLLSQNTPQIRKLAADIHFQLTTARNRNLITADEQQILRNSIGGFFGMSTGSHAVTTWIMESRAHSVKIMDPDNISPSNLNRMRYGWNTVGQDKISVVKAEINQLNPYTQVISTTKTDYATTLSFFINKPKLNFVVEAIDDLKAKIALRRLAKKYHLPYLMATDVGDNVFLDVERYDLTPQPQLFNGRVSNLDQIDFDHLSPPQRIELATQIVGLEHNSQAMLASLLNIQKTIPTWPQLGSTATIAGGIVATTLKMIILGEQVQSGRYYLDLDALLDASFNSPKKILIRQQLITKLTLSH